MAHECHATAPPRPRRSPTPTPTRYFDDDDVVGGVEVEVDAAGRPTRWSRGARVTHLTPDGRRNRTTFAVAPSHPDHGRVDVFAEGGGAWTVGADGRLVAPEERGRVECTTYDKGVFAGCVVTYGAQGDATCTFAPSHPRHGAEVRRDSGGRRASEAFRRPHPQAGAMGEFDDEGNVRVTYAAPHRKAGVTLHGALVDCDGAPDGADPCHGVPPHCVEYAPPHAEAGRVETFQDGALVLATFVAPHPRAGAIDTYYAIDVIDEDEMTMSTCFARAATQLQDGRALAYDVPDDLESDDLGRASGPLVRITYDLPHASAGATEHFDGATGECTHVSYAPPHRLAGACSVYTSESSGGAARRTCTLLSRHSAERYGVLIIQDAPHRLRGDDGLERTVAIHHDDDRGAFWAVARGRVYEAAAPPRDESAVCPITQDVCADPVRASDGHVYERAALLRWLATSPAAARSPLTRERLSRALRTPGSRFLRARRARIAAESDARMSRAAMHLTRHVNPSSPTCVFALEARLRPDVRRHEPL